MNQSEAGKKGYEKTKQQLVAHAQKKHEKTIVLYESNPKYCPNCDERLPYEKRRNKFCSKSCSATYNNQGVVRVATVKSEECAHCGTIKETRKNKYCDTCIKENVYSSKVTIFDDAGSDRTRKRIIIEVRGHKCENCGLAGWLGNPIPLDLDHIDGNPDNSNEDNLRLICPNCHAQTETYKGANRGGDSKRQKMRRRRYQEGKTY